MCSSRTGTTDSPAKRAARTTRALSPALVLALAPGILVSACGTKPPPEPVGISHVETPEPITGKAVDFAYDSLDARPVSASAMRGKVTVLAFVATYDLGSQAQVNYLVAMAKHDAAKVNYVMVALDQRTERELVEVYKTDLNVTFPVALADAETIGGGGPFGDVHRIPAVVVLDREGQMVWKKTGLAKPDEIRAAMRR